MVKSLRHLDPICITAGPYRQLRDDELEPFEWYRTYTGGWWQFCPNIQYGNPRPPLVIEFKPPDHIRLMAQPAGSEVTLHNTTISTHPWDIVPSSPTRPWDVVSTSPSRSD